MDATKILEIVKARRGLTTIARDPYLTAIIQGVIDDLKKNKGIALDKNNMEHVMFVVDFSDWRYASRDEQGGMPRHLEVRLHNLYVNKGGAG